MTSKFIEIFIDGAARNNGIPNRVVKAACSVVVYDKKKQIASSTRLLGELTNNQAEYEALILALTISIAADYVHPKIYSDSRTVCRQINGDMGCYSASLLPYYLSVLVLKRNYAFHLENVPRSYVWHPDANCKKILRYYDDYTSKPKMTDIAVVLKTMEGL